MVQVIVNAGGSRGDWFPQHGTEIIYFDDFPMIVDAPDSGVRTRVYYKSLEGDARLRRWQFLDGIETDELAVSQSAVWCEREWADV